MDDLYLLQGEKQMLDDDFNEGEGGDDDKDDFDDAAGDDDEW